MATKRRRRKDGTLAPAEEAQSEATTGTEAQIEGKASPSGAAPGGADGPGEPSASAAPAQASGEEDAALVEARTAVAYVYTSYLRYGTRTLVPGDQLTAEEVESLPVRYRRWVRALPDDMR